METILHICFRHIILVTEVNFIKLTVMAPSLKQTRNVLIYQLQLQVFEDSQKQSIAVKNCHSGTYKRKSKYLDFNCSFTHMAKNYKQIKSKMYSNYH